MEASSSIAKLEHKLKCTRIAAKLLRQGVPPNYIAANIELEVVDLPTLAKELGGKVRESVRGKKMRNPENFILENVRRSISATVLISLFLKFERDHHASAGDELFAELFACTWDAFCSALHPIAPWRLDIDAHQAWVLLRFVTTGELKTKTCICCGSKFPKIIPGETTCIICTQLSYAHCSKCGCKAERTHALYNSKWRAGDMQAVCPICRDRERRSQKRKRQLA